MNDSFLQKYHLLPPDKQAEVRLFVDFLFGVFSEKRLSEAGIYLNELPISEDLKAYLDKRLQELENSSEKRYSLEETEDYFKQKYQNKA